MRLVNDTRAPRSVLIAMTLISLTGCATSSGTGADRPVSEERGDILKQSEIQIHYTLGHSNRQIQLEAHESKITGQSQVDREVLKRCTVEAAKYSAFFRKVADFAEKLPTREPASQLDTCRSPYSILIRTNQGVRTHQGCRTTGDSSFGTLIREGEFLLYSQK